MRPDRCLDLRSDAESVPAAHPAPGSKAAQDGLSGERLAPPGRMPRVEPGERRMLIAITGATGFLGRYVVRHLAGAGHRLRCWHRPDSDRSRMDDVAHAVE